MVENSVGFTQIMFTTNPSGSLMAKFHPVYCFTKISIALV